MPRDNAFFRVLVRHPAAYRHWAGYANQLLRRGLLDDRSRELAVLRTAWRCQSPFEWGQHVAAAHRAGMSSDEMTRITVGPDEFGWTPAESVVLRAVDELHDDSRISEETWTTLAASFDEAQLIELLMLTGIYHFHAWALNTFRVPLEAGNAGLSAR